MSKKTTEEYLAAPYERVIIPEEGGGFSAYISEFEGCLAYGETPNEAFKNLEEVARIWIEAALEHSGEIPQAWNVQEFSGRFALRLPKSLHQDLAKLAEREGTSLNQYIVAKLSSSAREDVLFKRLSEIVQYKTSRGNIMIGLVIGNSANCINITPIKAIEVMGTSADVTKAQGILTSGSQTEEWYGRR